MSSVDSNTRRTTTYASPQIVERRQRMLSETWNLIAERGVENFTIRELCQRAGVSQGTFHNAFGTKEDIVELAVVEYATGAAGGHYFHGNETLEGQLERMVRVNTNILTSKRYIAAVMKVFWSDSFASSTRTTIGEVTKLNYQTYLRRLDSRQGLIPIVAVDTLSETLMLSYYAVLTRWTSGSLRDDQLAGRVAFDLLTILAGATRGGALREVREWQQEVANEGPRWKELKRIVTEQTPEPTPGSP